MNAFFPIVVPYFFPLRSSPRTKTAEELLGTLLELQRTAHRDCQQRPKSDQDRPHMPYMQPKTAQRSPKSGQDRRTAHRGLRSRTSQQRPKTGQHRPHMPYERPKTAHRGVENSLRLPAEAPNVASRGFYMSQDRTQRPPGAGRDLQFQDPDGGKSFKFAATQRVR